MVTINNYAVGLSLDAGNYIRNSSLSRKETAALKREINTARTPADKYTRTLSILDKALSQGAISQQTYNKALRGAKSNYQAATSGAKGFRGAVASLKTSILGATAAYISFRTVTSQVAAGLRDAAAFEQTQIQFKVLVGNAEEASDALRELRAFSAATPFQFENIAKAGQQMLAFKFSTDELVGSIKTLADISAGTGAPINELAAVIGKMRVQGRIFAEDINQLTGRGINVIDGLAEKFGNVREAVKDGKVQFEDLWQVLQGLTEEGGKFFGLTQELSQSAAGQVSTLTDEFKLLRQELVEPAIPFFIDSIQQAREGIKALKDDERGGFFGNLLSLGGERASALVAESEARNSEDFIFQQQRMRRRREEREQGLKAGALGTFGTGGLDAKQQMADLGAKLGKAFGPAVEGTMSVFTALGLKGVGDQLGDVAKLQSIHQNSVKVAQGRDRDGKPELDTSQLAPSVMRGTQEAYKIIANAQNQAEQKSLRIQQQQLEALRQLTPVEVL